MRTIDGLLDGVPAFKGLPAEHLELIAGCARNAVFTDGDELLREGERADSFFVIRHGTVVLETFVPGHGPFTVETKHAGELLGWSWLVPPYRTVFDARAVGVVRALQFDGACLRGKCDEDPALGYDLLKRFAGVIVGHLQATRLRLLDVYGKPGS